MSKHKDMVLKTCYFDPEGKLADTIAELRDFEDTYIDAYIEQSYDGELTLTGWRPMSDRELAAAKKRRAAARRAAAVRKAKKLEKDKEDLLKLAKKLGVKVEGLGDELQ